MNLFEGLKQSIVSSMKLSITEVLKEVRSDLEQRMKLREHLTELTSIVTTTASQMFIKQTSSNPRQKENQKKFFLLPALLKDQFMLKYYQEFSSGLL